MENVYEKAAVDGKDGNPLNVYGHGSSMFSMIDDSTLLPESPSLTAGLTEDSLADIVSAVKKFDSEDLDTVEVDTLASTGSFSTCFDCPFSADSVLTKAALLAVNKLSRQDTPLDTPQDVSNAGEKAPKPRKARKSAAKEQSHAQHDSEMDEGAPVLIDEKRKRRYVLFSVSSLGFFCSWSVI